MKFKMRAYEAEDYNFVRRMVYEAIFWRVSDKRPSLEEGLEYEGLIDALEGYPDRKGDTTVIATYEGQPVGMALYRFWAENKSIRGFIREDSPVVIIAIDENHRKSGLGGLLMAELAEKAKAQGLETLSLCVSKDNVALKLYEKQGYIVHEDIGASYNMIKHLKLPIGGRSYSVGIEEMLSMSHALYEQNKEDWSPMEPEYAKAFLLYMIEEMGEAISIIKKKGENQIMQDETIRERFTEEMCDMMMYYADVLNRFGITPQEYSRAYRKKFEKNISRNYKKDHANS